METNLCVKPGTTVRDAISILVDEGRRAIFVVDPDMRLLGLMTNGDMRRYLLSGNSLSQEVSSAMNAHPVVFHSREEVLASGKRYIVYPIVDDGGRLTDALFPTDLNEELSQELENVPLVIMAGGKGTRLYPYTRILPKAIIPIGRYSITERIIQNFAKYGCRKVFMVLNHKASMIKAYMSEVELPCEIEYVEEKTFSGTAGGLCLLRDRIDGPFFVSNCDILINDDLACAYLTHKKAGNKITYIASMLDHMVPYGVLNTTSDGQIVSITEKPHYSFLTNTGVYVLEREILDEIKPGEFIHITDLTERCIRKGMRTGVFPVSEKAWMDMGQIEEMNRMIQELAPED